jgi:hypothetical protein
MLLIAGAPTAPDPVRGNFMGSGRACYGMLTITARSIAWATPFSRCPASPYAVVDSRDDADGLRVTYRLLRPSAACRYPVLVLTHRANADVDIGWNVAGYPSLDSAKEQRHADAIDCYLYRPSLGR